MISILWHCSWYSSDTLYIDNRKYTNSVATWFISGQAEYVFALPKPLEEIEEWDFISSFAQHSHSPAVCAWVLCTLWYTMNSHHKCSHSWLRIEFSTQFCVNVVFVCACKSKISCCLWSCVYLAVDSGNRADTVKLICRDWLISPHLKGYIYLESWNNIFNSLFEVSYYSCITV